MQTLSELPIGSTATVTKILGADAVTTRLMEMGLVPGVTVAIHGTAPLGDPIEIELRGYRLSLRKSEASRVEI